MLIKRRLNHDGFFRTLVLNAPSCVYVFRVLCLDTGVLLFTYVSPIDTSRSDRVGSETTVLTYAVEVTEVFLGFPHPLQANTGTVL
jgi:hypothetical protein